LYAQGTVGYNRKEVPYRASPNIS